MYSKSQINGNLKFYCCYLLQSKKKSSIVVNKYIPLHPVLTRSSHPETIFMYFSDQNIITNKEHGFKINLSVTESTNWRWEPRNKETAICIPRMFHSSYIFNTAIHIPIQIYQTCEIPKSMKLVFSVKYIAFFFPSIK